MGTGVQLPEGPPAEMCKAKLCTKKQSGAVSSVVECVVDIDEAIGSIPIPRTTLERILAKISELGERLRLRSGATEFPPHPLPPRPRFGLRQKILAVSMDIKNTEKVLK